MKTLIINPLGAALKHYTAELVSVLDASGAEIDLVEFPEPSAGGGTRLDWLKHHLAALWSTRIHDRKLETERKCIITWPTLGYLDTLLAALIAPKAWIVIHDPVPLVQSVGSGKLGQLALRSIGNRARIIVHSEQAAQAVEAVSPSARVVRLPHPILPPQTRGPRVRATRPTVRVLGQYKADRDTDLMTAIARDFPDADFTVTGRGWPPVTGWQIDSRFVSEAEMEELISSAWTVLIPYRRFYQSGIAVRCLELGTPVVGPADSSLSALLRSAPSLLAGSRHEEWVRAVQSGLDMPREAILELGVSERNTTVAKWNAHMSARD
ncbi:MULTISPECIES: glycosyltransferase [unclassified Curtobacterium]|uniref:glycosyltransferase n=1 Tax=unclassified Curtobacterium TaxID=257496 RepID=UPI0011B83AC0|nr:MULTISPECIES: glycosyltransferase [unclassified Curtobacterium]WIB36517.1 glycosyltransferase [Curtobacterium sp. MCJR17_043]